jgi:hypothetical protein
MPHTIIRTGDVNLMNADDPGAFARAVDTLRKADVASPFRVLPVSAAVAAPEDNEGFYAAPAAGRADPGRIPRRVSLTT